MSHRICIFASELGSLLGKNRFKTIDDTIQEIVFRYEPEKTKIEFRELKDDVQKMLETDKEIQACMTSLPNVITCKDQSEHVEKLNDIERVRSDTIGVEIKKTTCKRKREHLEKELHIVQVTSKKAKSQINCRMGIQEEDKCIIPNSQRSFSRMIPELNIMLYGKVDGFNEETQTVIEVKTRKNRLWKRLWPQEVVQIMTYMFISKVNQAQLIEKCGDDTFVRMYNFDDSLWSTYMDVLKLRVEQIRRQLY